MYLRPVRKQRRNGTVLEHWALVESYRTARGKPAVQMPLVIAVARGFRWKTLLENGRFASIGELAQAAGMDASYVGRLLNLTLLAPDIILAILKGEEPSGLSLEKLKSFPLEWNAQREGIKSD